MGFTLRRTLLHLTLALIGGALLVLTVRRVGWSAVQESIVALGWWYVPIVALGGVRFAARARAWQACAGSARLPFKGAFFATLAGDSLGNLTPFGLLASEPAKVFFVKSRVDVVAAVASVAAENAFYVASVLVMVGAGALTFVSIVDLPPVLRLAAQLVIAGVIAGGLVAFWLVRRQPAFLSRLARRLAAWTGRAATAPDRLREIEVHFYSLVTWPARRIAHVVFWEAAFHAAAVAEVFLVLRLLPGARSITLTEAFILETTGRLIVVAFKFVPFRLGVDEAGSAIVAGALSLDPRLGVALALVRRLRVLFWNAIGLVLLATRRGG